MSAAWSISGCRSGFSLREGAAPDKQGDVVPLHVASLLLGLGQLIQLGTEDRYMQGCGTKILLVYV